LPSKWSFTSWVLLKVKVAVWMMGVTSELPGFSRGSPACTARVLGPWGLVGGSTA
jgi:hypothetical protein